MNSTATRKALTIALAATATILWLSTTSTEGRAQKASPTISDLVWMSGDWQTAAGGRVQVEEHWTRPAAGVMIGMGRTIAGDRLVEVEYLRLEQRSDAIYYVAARCPDTDFKLTRLSGQEAVFENPQHDFPKRVIYRKTSDGLFASVDGGEGTKSQKFAYLPMAR